MLVSSFAGLSAARISAFSAGFYPLLEEESEFAAKWIALCDAHLSDTGIRESFFFCLPLRYPRRYYFMTTSS